MRRILPLVALLWGAPVLAQRVHLDVALPAAPARDGPTIIAGNLLAEDKTRELLRNAYPTQISFRLDLWRKSRFFYDLEKRVEWQVFVSYDPTVHDYTVIRVQGNQKESFGSFGSIASAEAQIDRPFQPPTHASRSGKYYYTLSVDIQTLTVSDLDALQDWLRGPVAKGNPLTALGNGVGTVLSQVLGKKQHSEQQSRTFVVP